jgi:hypothetical protein
LKFDGVLELEACGGVILLLGIGDRLKTSVTVAFLGINSAGNTFICLRNQSHGFGSGILSPFGFTYFLKTLTVHT